MESTVTGNESTLLTDRMIESAHERGLAYPARKRTGDRTVCGSKMMENVQRNGRSALQKKKSSISSGPSSSFTDDHNDFLRNLVDDDPSPPQLAVSHIVGRLVEHFENLCCMF
ncbi:uncharacterized protein BX663DRAFT_273636 [Cokeromyces recurvatus]|uniref:uncharacterized protein n=1 Tax=Cokeromyces recurvatus TaxID=90255 RepID=UPI00221F9C97|nr:uncharacterized protein BX663DRAFT_273636 [Cokeromyces recurvatus]KAI7898029.1 hypothetical protein BX663DRAFT_273636 [Cokeromyces recurvatus]